MRVLYLILVICIAWSLSAGCLNVQKATEAPANGVVTHTVAGPPAKSMLLYPPDQTENYSIKTIPFAWRPWNGAAIYELELALDREFKQLVLTTNTAHPVYTYNGMLEYHTDYYWRIKALELYGQPVSSDWSDVFTFRTAANSPYEVIIDGGSYYGVQLIRPNNGSIDNPMSISFLWVPWENATMYRIDLAKDSEFKQMVVTASVPSTVYDCDATLDYDTVYFWRVKVIEINDKLNPPADWSATFAFQTEMAPIIPTHPTADSSRPVYQIIPLSSSNPSGGMPIYFSWTLSECHLISD